MTARSSDVSTGSTPQVTVNLSGAKRAASRATVNDPATSAVTVGNTPAVNLGAANPTPQTTIDLGSAASGTVVTIDKAAAVSVAVDKKPIINIPVGGDTGKDEVWIGDNPPTAAEIELWYQPVTSTLFARVAGAWVDVSAGTSTGAVVGYTHVQPTAADTWIVDHPLSFQPNVSVVDSAGSQVEPDIQYTGPTQVILTFSAAFAGEAYFS